MAESTIPVGSKVRVLDTQNVRSYNKDAVGYEFVTTADRYYANGRVLCPTNKYGVNYEDGDLEVIETSVVNNYQIY